MCLFPRSAKPNIYDLKKSHYDRYYINRYDCGVCPECLAKKSRYWALRAGMEAKNSPSMMITLTYDDYIYDEHGQIIGEEVDTRPVCKKDCQDFIKRLRAYFYPQKLKYIISAEYGKKTGRSHYHALIFGVNFPDCTPYKKSKRGNQIFRSQALARIWGKGICTVDSLNASAQTARYCTKYCAKDSGRNDLFMLFSRGIGEEALRQEFNGLYYVVSGRKYPIPKTIWQWYISTKYKDCGMHFTTRYVNNIRKQDKFEGIDWTDIDPFFERVEITTQYQRLKKQANRNALQRAIYRAIRNRDSIYRRYIAYWRRLSASIEKSRPSIMSRILALPNSKYWTYKQKALAVYINRQRWLTEEPAPRSRKYEFIQNLYKVKPHLPSLPCHNTADDNKKRLIDYIERRSAPKFKAIQLKIPNI